MISVATAARLFCLLAIFLLPAQAVTSKDDCPSSYFKCGDGTCVSFLFLCDGEADCPNSADENCNGTQHNAKNLQCEEGKFSCPGIDICLPNKWKCDGHRDCPNGFDEQNCTTQTKCDGFRCKSGECIPEKWRCDSNHDCVDGSDEANCKSSRINPHCIRENGKFECASGKCIPHEKVCNKHNDCPGGDDEGQFCDIDGCHSKNCTHGCFQTPQGPQCDCNEGFRLADDQRTCVDIDECADSKNDVCSQKCTNTRGSFRCSCSAGFRLVNGTRCVVESAEPVLIYTDAHNVRGYWLKRQLHFLIARGLSNAMGVDMHKESKLVFWTDIGVNSSYVFSAHFHNKDVRAVVTAGLVKPEDIAVDYVANNLYITDSGLKQIIVCKLDGSTCVPIIKRGLDNVRAIALDVERGRMFWTDWGEKSPGIYTAHMDGSHQEPLVNRNIVWPNGLTYDRFKNRIYWSDAKLERMEYYDLNTRKRFVLIDDAVYHPHCLTMFEDDLYFSDWDMFSVGKANKFTGHNMTAVFRRPNKIYGMHIYHPVHYSSLVNPCWGASCSHLCLISSPTQFRCACPNQMTLDPKDPTTCVEKHDHSYLLVGLGNTVKKVYPKNIGKDVTSRLLNKLPDKLEFIHEYAYSHAHDDLYMFNAPRLGIVKRNLKSGEDTVIFNGYNLTSISALTYDEFSDNLYWLDHERHALVVGTSDGRKQATLIDNLETPSTLALYQERNELYIGSMGMHPQIIVADLDGKNSKLLISNIGYPTALAICKRRNELFWSDARKGTIESVSLNDTSSKTIVKSGLGHVESLVIKENTLYWTNADTPYLYSMKLDDEGHIQLASIGALSKEKKKLVMIYKESAKNDCQSGAHKCSDICVFGGFKKINTYSVPMTHCLCGQNSSLAEDRHTCDQRKHCADGMYTCPSTKQCIRMSEVCDGHRNCENNEDEEGCPEVKPCSMYESRCDPSDLKSHCIPNSWFCDGEVDCENGFDELQCHNHTGKSIYSEVAHKLAVNGSCDAGYFKCDQNVCMPWHFVCDGTPNCADRSDEGPDCLTKCGCKNNGKCYLDQSTNTWACQCPPEFEGRDCDVRRDLGARSNEHHQIVMKESVHKKGHMSSEDGFPVTGGDAGVFWLVMMIVAIVLLVVGIVLFGYLYMVETDGRMYMIKRSINRKLNYRRNGSFGRNNNFNFNSQTADLIDRMECEHDEETPTHDKNAQLIC